MAAILTAQKPIISLLKMCLKCLLNIANYHYKAKLATRQGRYNLAAQKLREWFQSVVLPKYSSTSQNITIVSERTAILLPFGVRAPSGQILSIFVRKTGAFLYLQQLEDIGVNPASVRKRYTFDNYEGDFMHYVDLSDTVLNSRDKELYDWWLNEGLPTVDKYSKDFSVAHSFVLEHLGFDLPDEWERLEQELDALIQSLSIKPMWILSKIGWQVDKLSYSQRTKRLAEQISEKTWEIRQERPKPNPKITTVIAFDNLAKKIGELQTPNGTTLEFFVVEDCNKIFAH